MECFWSWRHTRTHPIKEGCSANHGSLSTTEKYEKQTLPVLPVIPALALYLTFSVIPSVMGFFYSFTDWNSFSSEINFVGLDNVKLIFCG